MDLDRIDTVLESQEVPPAVRRRIRTLLSRSDVDTWLDPDEDLPVEHTDTVEPPTRLVAPQAIGRGGMADVFRVLDTTLDRDVALKVIRPELQANPRAIRRFINEAKVTARLQHPGIVPVHDLGQMPDGRHYFTMKLVRGRTLTQVLDEQPPLRRGMDVFRAICAAMAYAHDQGVVHRDLKPDNAMIGAFGEILVLDWGVARLPDATEETGGHLPVGPGLTRDGEITGTPAYMAPEQARGDISLVGPHTDVYALGLILFEILAGRPARVGTLESTLFDSAIGKMPELPEGLDPELARVCVRCLQPKLEDRYPTAEALLEDVEAWLHGARRREQAEAEVARADTLLEGVQALRTQVELLRRRIQILKADEAEPEEIWSIEDLQRAHALELVRAEVQWRQALYTALSHDPELPAAHTRLADDFRQAADDAAARGDSLEEARCEVEVRRHDRGQHAAWLRGRGRLILTADPPASGRLFQMAERRRTLVPVQDRALKTSVDLRLDRGSWLVELDGPHGTVRVPVRIERAAVWDNRNPEGQIEPIRLDVPHDPGRECYIPAGWFLGGGDPEVKNPHPSRRIWVDGFVVRTFPVTHGEFVAFLNDLVATGRADEADRWSPRDGGSTVTSGAEIYLRDQGRYRLPDPDPEHGWSPELPVFLVVHAAARAFAAWEAERTGLPWRLLTTHERQKAGRGVDGRRFVWGDTPDVRRANVRNPRTGGVRPLPVDSMPEDCSIYGVRGLSGNISDWLDDHTFGTGPVVDRNGRSAPVPFDPEIHQYATFAGGAWNAGIPYARCANYSHYGQGSRVSALGFRLARSVPTP